MATISPDPSRRGNYIDTVTWSSAATADTINSYEIMERSPDCVTFHVKGTFGGATVTIQGSNDNVSFATLDDTFGTATSTTTEAVFGIGDFPRYIKPGITGGTGDSITVIAVIRYSTY